MTLNGWENAFFFPFLAQSRCFPSRGALDVLRFVFLVCFRGFSFSLLFSLFAFSLLSLFFL